MDSRIYVKNDETLALTPQDFANRAVVRGVFSDEAITAYATLRVLGHDQVAAFACTFAEFVTARVETVAAICAAFESTRLFESVTDEIEDAIGVERVRTELAARLSEAAGFTRDAAMSARIEFRFSPRAFRNSERDERDFTAFAAKRREEGQCESAREAGQNDAMREDTARESSLAMAELMHGKLSEDQIRNGGRGADVYDVSTQRPAWN